MELPTDVQRIENNINLIHQKEQPDDLAQPVVQYEGDEEDIVCGRFPHLSLCACEINSAVALKEINLFQVYPGIYMGPFQAAFKTKELIEKGVTHILNASCKEYTKRSKYFKYLDIPV